MCLLSMQASKPNKDIYALDLIISLLFPSTHPEQRQSHLLNLIHPHKLRTACRLPKVY